MSQKPYDPFEKNNAPADVTAEPAPGAETLQEVPPTSEEKQHLPVLAWISLSCSVWSMIFTCGVFAMIYYGTCVFAVLGLVFGMFAPKTKQGKMHPLAMTGICVSLFALFFCLVAIIGTIAFGGMAILWALGA